MHQLIVDLEQEIDFQQLPIEILNKIPLTIRVKKNKYKLSELPPEIQYILQEYLYKKPPDISYNDAIRDLKPEISIYNDLTPLSVKEAVIEYFKNYMYVETGAYPFDVTFGCDIRRLLQSKDTQLIQTLLSNELRNIIITLSNDYQLPIRIVKANLYRNTVNAIGDQELFSEYIFHIELEVFDSTVVVQI